MNVGIPTFLLSVLSAFLHFWYDSTMKSCFYFSIAVLIGFALLPNFGQCNSAQEDLTITKKEKKSLDELKDRVFNDIPNDEKKRSDLYLIKWLRASGGNINKAEIMLRENLQWRKDYKMDNILNEDFSDMEFEFPIDLEGVDKTGRPVLAVHVDQWNVQASHIAGKHDENYRYSMRALEIMSQKIKDAQARGKMVTRYQVIFDMNGLNFKQHACFQCIPPYLKFILAFQKYYPEMVDNLVVINMPSGMEAFFRVIRPVISSRMRKVLKVFGTNRNEWKDFLLTLIDSDQLDESFGGTRNGLDF